MRSQNIVKPSADDIAASARAAGKKGPPPVHLWNPPFCGDLDMRIARDGTWFYLGTPIGKVGITVDDAPFVAVDVERTDGADGPDLTFTTNVGDTVVAGPDHPIRVTRDPATGEPSPYVMVRRGLEALIDRKSFYRLVDIGEHRDHDGARWFGLVSRGAFFPVIPSAELEV